MGHFLKSDIAAQECHKVVFHRLCFLYYTRITAGAHILIIISRNMLMTLSFSLLSLLHKGMDLSSYHGEIDTFIQWCDKNCLVLNVNKTQEMVLDPRSTSEHKPVIIKDTEIQ